MVVTLEKLPEIPLAGRTLSLGDIWKLTAGLAPYFRAMSNTRTSSGGGREFGVEILLPVCQDHGRIM